MGAASALTAMVAAADSANRVPATEVLPANRPREFGAARSSYALGMLLGVGTLTMVLGSLTAILLQPIGRDLHLTDWQLGLFSGPAFAIFYSLAQLPLSTLGDRRRRVSLIALALASWGATAALQGVAVGFASLLLARAAVGVSEAAIGPASQSILSDLFPIAQRARAASTYALLLPVGIALGIAVGGWAREQFGWRHVLFGVGALGVAAALLVRMTLPEPTRGYWDGGASAHAADVSMRDSLRFLFGISAFRHLIAGQVLAVFAFYSSVFGPAYLERSFALTPTQIGAFVGAMSLIAVPALLLGGWISDRASLSSRRAPLVCASAFNALAALSFAAYYLAWDRTSLLVIGLAGSIVPSSFGVVIATAQNLAPPAMRARAAALLSTIPAIIGGLGPPAAGALSDSLAGELGRESMRWALLGIALPSYLWAALHFWLGSRTLDR